MNTYNARQGGVSGRTMLEEQVRDLIRRETNCMAMIAVGAVSLMAVVEVAVICLTLA